MIITTNLVCYHLLWFDSVWINKMLFIFLYCVNIKLMQYIFIHTT